MTAGSSLEVATHSAAEGMLALRRLADDGRLVLTCAVGLDVELARPVRASHLLMMAE